MARENPNIIVTGTPGVGKSSLCDLLAQNTGLRHLQINQIVKERGCHEGWDANLESWIVDEDKVSPIGTSCDDSKSDDACLQLLDSIEDELRLGGCIIDWHACDLFPKSWIDLVIVLRTDTTRLYDRLTARHYSERKLQENMDSEIMEVLLDEARASYDEEIIIELQSNDIEDIENNVERAEHWLINWRRDHLP